MGGSNRYLGNAQIEVTLTSVGLPLVDRVFCSFAAAPIMHRYHWCNVRGNSTNLFARIIIFENGREGKKILTFAKFVTITFLMVCPLRQLLWIASFYEAFQNP